MNAGIAELEQQIDALRARITGLRGKLGGSLDPAVHDTLRDALHELETSLEELQVAHEELMAQDLALRSALDAARLERTRYQELFDQAPEAFLVTDRSGTIREANKAAAALMNTSPQFLVGHPIASFISQDERPSFRSELNGGSFDQPQEWDVQMKPRNAAPFAAAITMVPMTDPSGSAQALRWAIKDVTERVMLACLWRVRNRTRELRAVVLKTSVGLELRVIQPDGVVISSELLKEWARVLSRSDELRETLEGKGWEKCGTGMELAQGYSGTAI